MSLLSHRQLGFIGGVSHDALRCHCSCHWFHASVVIDGWKGLVVIGSCLDDMPGFVGWIGSGSFVDVVLCVEVGVIGSCRWVVEFSI